MVRQRIINEASELFGQIGVKSVTMDDLARHLCISKRTIYENFKSKEGVLIACIKSLSEKRQKSFYEADSVLCAILAMLRNDVKSSNFNTIVEIKKYYPQVYKQDVSRFYAEQRSKMEQLIHGGIREGIFRKDFNVEIMAYFFCEGLVHNVEGFGVFSSSCVFEYVAITMLRGICTEKGIVIIDNF